MTTPSVNSNTVNPSGRVQVIASPIASPGSCGVCGKSSHDRGFVDPRMDFEFYGTLIFCYDCIGDMARVMGYLSDDELEKIRETVDDQNDELNTLRQAVLGLEAAVDGLVNYRDLYGNAAHPRGRAAVDLAVAAPGPVPGPSEGAPPETGSTPTEPVSDGTSTNTNTDQPVVEQGPNDVLSPTGTVAGVDELLGLP